ncbi:hypothetical protein AC623_20395 [Bacillus sp. FJAT-27231]|uniref:hypothetical protein n=1 Tax=Bacillus sp. FJAT-27231 TaxID=1679168 RepID=UPI0006713FDA|nr:hypothetical protein [Bacillus sp. FJAT-27231]KMY52505.1 hypothetical protein AC623_20395 [Bacillus sp. FJAT-27231]
MENEKIRKLVSFDEETFEYVSDYMDENKIRFNGEAIARICKEHKELKENQWSIKYISEVVTNALKETFKEELNKIRIGTNSADKNTQILIELLNGIYFFESYENLITTSVQEMEGVKTAKQEVQERITNQRQKKLEYEASKGGI